MYIVVNVLECSTIGVDVNIANSCTARFAVVVVHELALAMGIPTEATCASVGGVFQEHLPCLSGHFNHLKDVDLIVAFVEVAEKLALVTSYFDWEIFPKWINLKSCHSFGAGFNELPPRLDVIFVQR